MKIYRVKYTETGETRSVWTSYRSAVGSGAQARARTEVEVAHVPEDAWKPANSLAEARLRRVEELWNALSFSDEEGLDLLLEELVKRQQRVKKVTPPPKLGDEAKREAAMLLMNRLVDAD